MNFSNLPPGCTLDEIDAAFVQDDEFASLLDDEVLELLFAESAEDRTPLQLEIEATTATINACPYYAADARAIYTLGALRGMLQGIAGAGDYCTHGALFDEKTTKALRELLEAIG